MFTDRIIGKLRGEEEGAMLIVIGGVHGNEYAGVDATAKVFRRLRDEMGRDPGIKMKGIFLGLIGNRLARKASRRFIKKDLNRQWYEENVGRIFSAPEELLDEEDKELKALLTIISSEIIQEKPSRIVILDLHTTSAEGGVFSIVDDQPESLNIALGFGAPVIRGLYQIFDGTILRFFNGSNFGIPTTALAFEAGQHDDPLALNRSESAILHLLHYTGLVQEHLQADLTTPEPAMVAEITYAHHITPEDHFSMKPGFKNFQHVRKGEIIATDIKGEIAAPYDCRILMPLYQKQGSDGFFLIKEMQP